MSLPHYEVLSINPQPNYMDGAHDETEILFDNGTQNQTWILIYNEDPGTRVKFSRVSEITVSPENAAVKMKKNDYVVNPGSTAEFNLVTTGVKNRVSFSIVSQGSAL